VCVCGGPLPHSLPTATVYQLPQSLPTVHSLPTVIQLANDVQITNCYSLSTATELTSCRRACQPRSAHSNGRCDLDTAVNCIIQSHYLTVHTGWHETFSPSINNHIFQPPKSSNSIRMSTSSMFLSPASRNKYRHQPSHPSDHRIHTTRPHNCPLHR
jgi:hypothetical protein